MDEEDIAPPRPCRESEKSYVDLMHFVEATGVLDEFPSMVDTVRGIMGMSESNNLTLAAVKRGLKRAQTDMLFHQYGLLFRENEIAIEKSMRKKRVAQEQKEHARKAKYLVCLFEYSSFY